MVPYKHCFQCAVTLPGLRTNSRTSGLGSVNPHQRNDQIAILFISVTYLLLLAGQPKRPQEIRVISSSPERQKTVTYADCSVLEIRIIEDRMTQQKIKLISLKNKLVQNYSQEFHIEVNNELRSFQCLSLTGLCRSGVFSRLI
jgi:hypothetical protein